MESIKYITEVTVQVVFSDRTKKYVSTSDFDFTSVLKEELNDADAMQKRFVSVEDDDLKSVVVRVEDIVRIETFKIVEKGGEGNE